MNSKKTKFSAPSDKTSIRMYADFNNSNNNFRYRWVDYTKEMKKEKSPAWFYRPKGYTAPADDLKRVRIRVRKYDSDGNPYVYQWNFRAASK